MLHRRASIPPEVLVRKPLKKDLIQRLKKSGAVSDTCTRNAGIERAVECSLEDEMLPVPVLKRASRRLDGRLKAAYGSIQSRKDPLWRAGATTLQGYDEMLHSVYEYEPAGYDEMFHSVYEYEPAGG
ncbi:hypothetical protein P5673_021020 [Acropora cervicornis]|uniref:Uncharacterized protein n=1 Tax=Acropora cervicornis TaxID=6130 RepID=A0AAD9Q8X2_ACRCE|nr:hypothetical protein P5673_021020 [Acropora cervicornis]